MININTTAHRSGACVQSISGTSVSDLTQTTAFIQSASQEELRCVWMAFGNRLAALESVDLAEATVSQPSVPQPEKLHLPGRTAGSAAKDSFVWRVPVISIEQARSDALQCAKDGPQAKAILFDLGTAPSLKDEVCDLLVPELQARLETLISLYVPGSQFYCGASRLWEVYAVETLRKMNMARQSLLIHRDFAQEELDRVFADLPAEKRKAIYDYYTCTKFDVNNRRAALSLTELGKRQGWLDSRGHGGENAYKALLNELSLNPRYSHLIYWFLHLRGIIYNIPQLPPYVMPRGDVSKPAIVASNAKAEVATANRVAKVD